jgi:hypothetical protein
MVPGSRGYFHFKPNMPHSSVRCARGSMRGRDEPAFMAAHKF